jgi:hypothetical protein
MYAKVAKKISTARFGEIAFNHDALDGNLDIGIETKLTLIYVST